MTHESPTARRPLRLLLVGIGTRGDVQPMLALAQAAAARGHQPRVAAPPEFRDWIEGHGFEFTPVGLNIRQFIADNPEVLTGRPAKAMAGWQKFFETLPQQAREVRAAAQGMHAIVWGGLAFSVPSVAEFLRIPALGVLYSTSLIPSAQHPPVALPWQNLPRWANRLLWFINRAMGERMLGPILTSARAELGLPRVGMHQHMFEDAHFMVATDEEVFPSDPAWGGRFARASYVFYDDPAPLDAQLQAWLDAGEPPVFVDFGSMSGAGTERASGVVLQALAGTGRRCLIGAGLVSAGAHQKLPTGWRVVRAAPHALLFPRLAAVIHHGGAGTIANALRAGVPQVILPLILDQYQHAHRLHLAGLVPPAVPMERITAKGLLEALNAALALPATRRRQVAERLRASDGRGEIVRRVEAMVDALPNAEPAAGVRLRASSA